jgi:hypothetical protein
VRNPGGTAWLRRLSVLGACAALSGCAAGAVTALPAPPTTVAGPPTTAVADLQSGFLSPVGGNTTSTSVVIAPGPSTLQGTVTGPGGPVPGAVVLVERVTDTGARGDFETSTRADGSWAAPDILGGRYRVRAWRAPDLAATQPVTLFLQGGETRQVQIQVQQFGGDQVSSSLAPDPPVVDRPANLVVQVTAATVSPADGVVRAVPVPGMTVQLQGSSEWELSGSNPATTDGAGQVSWQLVCMQAGAQPLQVLLGDGTNVGLDHISPCVNPTVPSTTSSTSTTTTVPGEVTTSTSTTKGHH